MSTQHPGLLTRVVVVRVHPEGPSRLVAQLADAARSDRADRGSNPREPTIPAWRNRWDHAEGDIVEWQDAALSARKYGFDSRCPRQDGLVATKQVLLRREGTATLEVS